jgi:hypothetical protein
MNILGKWGKKLLIAGISSFVLDIVFRLIGISFLSDLGGDYINFALIIFGSIGMYLDKNLIEKIDAKDGGTTLQMTQAILEEKKARKIVEWDNNLILEYINQTLEGNKFIIWVKDKKISFGNGFDIYISLNFSLSDELISPTQEITLKDGKKFTQKKHDLAIKKEYSEKVFICGNNLIEDLFEKIIKLEKIGITIFLPENDICVLNILATREQYLKLRDNKVVNIFERLKYFSSNYDFDHKNFIFSEIKPVV